MSRRRLRKNRLGADIRQVLFGRASPALHRNVCGSLWPARFTTGIRPRRPVERSPRRCEPRGGLDTVGIPLGGGPRVGHGLLLALRNRRGDLDAADAQFLQQEAGRW